MPVHALLAAEPTPHLAALLADCEGELSAAARSEARSIGANASSAVVAGILEAELRSPSDAFAPLVALHLEPFGGGDLLANEDVLDLAGAIELLGGTLTEAQRAKEQRVLLRRRWLEREAGRRPQPPRRRGRKPRRSCGGCAG
jgi:hypothetical protein